MKVANTTFMKGTAAAVVILMSAIIFVPIARVSGVGMMPQVPPAVNPNPSATTPLNENQQSPTSRLIKVITTSLVCG